MDFCIVDATETPRHVRALFISDVHLGSRACKAERLLDFLRHHDADTIYLVGDIVDGWQLRSGWHWPQAHNDVIQKLGLQGIEWVVLGDHSGGSMQVRTLRRRYSSSRSP